MAEPHPAPQPTLSASPQVRPAPSLEPPTDDRRAERRARLRGELRRPQPPRAPAARVTPEVDPDVRVAVARVLRLSLEVYDGQRSPQLLRALLPAPLVHTIVARARHAARQRQPSARLGPVHVQAVTPAVMEAFALVHRGGHAHAVAARMELAGHRWRCTALWLG